MIFNWDDEVFKQERTALFHTEFSFPSISGEKLIVLMLMAEAWCLKSFNYIPYLAAENFLFFKNPADRDAFEDWLKQLNLSEIRDRLIPDLDIDDLLNEDAVRLMGKVPYEFEGGYRNNEQDQEWVEGNYEVCLWLVQHTGDKPGERAWFDYAREVIWFENASIATNFKLRFCEDGAKAKKKASASSKSKNDLDDDYMGAEWLKKRLYEAAEQARRDKEDRYNNSGYSGKPWRDPSDPFGR